MSYSTTWLSLESTCSTEGIQTYNRQSGVSSRISLQARCSFRGCISYFKRRGIVLGRPMRAFKATPSKSSLTLWTISWGCFSCLPRGTLPSCRNTCTSRRSITTHMTWYRILLSCWLRTCRRWIRIITRIWFKISILLMSTFKGLAESINKR